MEFNYYEMEMNIQKPITVTTPHLFKYVSQTVLGNGIPQVNYYEKKNGMSS